MTLKAYQHALELDTVYEVTVAAPISGSEQLQPNLEVVGGTVDIYGCQVEPESAPTGMFKTADGFTGIAPFLTIPRYIYIEQNTGTTTSIIASGLNVTAVA